MPVSAFTSQNTRGVWVYLEHTRGKVAGVCWELLTPARQVADALGVELGVVIIGDLGTRLATEAFAYGADVAYLVERSIFSTYRTETHLRALSHLVHAYRPETLFFSATVNSGDLAAAIAAELQTGLGTGVIALEIEVETRTIVMTRPVGRGDVLATLRGDVARPQVLTLRPHLLPIPVRRAGNLGRIVRIDYTLNEPEVATKLLQFTPAAPGDVLLEDAEIIVTAGRGIGSRENLRLVEELAAALGGTLGATRAVVDRGWLPPSRQIGQTGRTVRPRVYVAVGVSGARQHLDGMRHAGAIVAINQDAEAPIMQMATTGIVGDLFVVVPALTRRALAARQQPARRG